MQISFKSKSCITALKNDTKIIVPRCLSKNNNYLVVDVNKTYDLDDLEFETIPSYNQKKDFHPKEKEYVGYNLLINNQRLYIMGDTDRTLEADSVKTDICFVPIGWTYTMDLEEAVSYINKLKPKKVIPIHYGKIIGDGSLGEEFKSKIDKNIKVEIFIK